MQERQRPLSEQFDGRSTNMRRELRIADLDETFPPIVIVVQLVSEGVEDVDDRIPRAQRRNSRRTGDGRHGCGCIDLSAVYFDLMGA